MCDALPVIGPRDLSPALEAFNTKWAAPYGRVAKTRHRLVDAAARLSGSRVLRARALGPFGFQPGNNATRVFEYPWAALAVPVEAGEIVVDIGGSLGGLQFVLAKEGASVINVDPSDAAAMGWPLDQETFADMNRAFGTTVELRKRFLADAGIESESVDNVYCISTIEHIPQAEIASLMKEIRRILRIGGHAILTVDLFYDLTPFTDRSANVHGTNIDIAALIGASGMTLVQGDRAQLNGYPEFDPRVVLSQAQDHVQGHLAVNTAQAFVLRK